jgi:hypothetical protein
MGTSESTQQEIKLSLMKPVILYRLPYNDRCMMVEYTDNTKIGDIHVKPFYDSGIKSISMYGYTSFEILEPKDSYTLECSIQECAQFRVLDKFGQKVLVGTYYDLQGLIYPCWCPRDLLMKVCSTELPSSHIEQISISTDVCIIDNKLHTKEQAIKKLYDDYKIDVKTLLSSCHNMHYLSIELNDNKRKVPNMSWLPSDRPRTLHIVDSDYDNVCITGGHYYEKSYCYCDKATVEILKQQKKPIHTTKDKAE